MDNFFDTIFSRAQEEARTKGVSGVVVGRVTNNNDDGHLGRVKIHFDWLSDDNETDWTRIATLMGGSGRGSFFLPEIDDEVLVAFENGDINSPYVVGVLWSKEDKPPEQNADGQNNIRKIRSRSGHEIIFDDKNGKELVEIHTKDGHRLVLDDGTEKIILKDKTDRNSVEIDSSGAGSISVISKLGTVSIKAQNIRLVADQAISLSAKGTMEIKGSMVNIN